MISKYITDHTRKIAVIQIFNAEREETKYFNPNDTMYVQVEGLSANKQYKVDCVSSPDGQVITTLTAQADADGVIAASPIWYEVGFTNVFNATLGRWVARLPPADLGLKAFYIRVQDAEAADTLTDFKLPFYVVFGTRGARPKPIINAGRMVASEFVIENAFDIGDELYVRADNLELLPDPAPASGKVTIFVVPFDGGYYKNGDQINNVVARQDVLIADLATGVHLTATTPAGFPDIGGASWSTIPTGAAGHSFSVIVDVNGNGIFDVKKSGTTDYYLDGIDGNGAAGFIVKMPPIPPLGPKDYIPANIASGGLSWLHAWFENWPDYDYRDTFNADGSGTQYGWDWQYGGYGVKALWNPYLSHDPQVPNSATADLYYGKTVDVYIVNATALDLTGATLLAPVTGTYKMTMPVQYACTNGAAQQTIWRASYDSPMAVGNYCVVVDVDRDGYISDGDLVDNLHKTESTPSDGVGFKVQ
jgi:hypothetical protein